MRNLYEYLGIAEHLGIVRAGSDSLQTIWRVSMGVDASQTKPLWLDETIRLQKVLAEKHAPNQHAKSDCCDPERTDPEHSGSFDDE